MDANLNNEIQDAGAVLVAAKKYQAELATVGSTETETQRLEDLVASLTAKDVAYESAVSAGGKMTAEQNSLMEEGVEIIGKLKAVVKIAFYRDDAMYRTFHVGTRTPGKVARMLAELAYLKEQVTANAAALAARGFGESDLTALTTCYENIQAKDAGQENNKKVRSGLRIERDALLKEMQEAKRLIRGSAKVVFRNNPTILNEFKSIIRRASAKKSAETGSEGTPSA
jgi:hypothetical protein